MIPVGSKVMLKKWPFAGIVIGHINHVPIIRIHGTEVSVDDIVSYTDEDGDVRIMEEPIT
jgi:hypothetical protein